MSTCASDIRRLLTLRMWPALLKARSALALDAGTHKVCRATHATTGHRCACAGHHDKESGLLFRPPCTLMNSLTCCFTITVMEAGSASPLYTL